MNGAKINPRDYPLGEMAFISTMCNDSSLEYNTDKETYGKVGESTETALKVLVEKMNLNEVNKKELSLAESVNVCCNFIENSLSKVYTLEFSRDRKSMSVYCEPKSDALEFYPVKGATMFVKGIFNIFCNFVYFYFFVVRCTRGNSGPLYSCPC